MRCREDSANTTEMKSTKVQNPRRDNYGEMNTYNTCQLSHQEAWHILLPAYLSDNIPSHVSGYVYAL